MWNESFENKSLGLLWHVGKPSVSFRLLFSGCCVGRVLWWATEQWWRTWRQWEGWENQITRRMKKHNVGVWLQWGRAEKCLLVQVIKMQSSEDKYVKFKFKISTGGPKIKHLNYQMCAIVKTAVDLKPECGYLSVLELIWACSILSRGLQGRTLHSPMEMDEWKYLALGLRKWRVLPLTQVCHLQVVLGSEVLGGGFSK